MAKELKARLLLIPTGVEQVPIRFVKPEQRLLDTLTVHDAHHFSEKEEFGEGSMRHKINAVIDFVSEVPDAQGLIISPDVIKKTLEKNRHMDC